MRMLDVFSILALLGALPVCVMYFTSLHYFGKALKQSHPEIYARFQSQLSAPSSQSYAALLGIRKDRSLQLALSPLVAAQFRQTYRYLIVGAVLFMVGLLAGLGSSVVAKA